jgi:hypothetical protein
MGSSAAGNVWSLQGHVIARIRRNWPAVDIMVRGDAGFRPALCPQRVKTGSALVEHLMPVKLTTLPHFSVSSAISLPKSAGEPASTVPPRSASRVFMLGSARPALISLFSFSTISAGVALGAPTPYQVLAS